MPDYYDDLRNHPDDARVVGWESRLAQLTRFELVRSLLSPEDRLLDLGAGLGDLARYVAETHPRVTYRGLESRPEFVARARTKRPSVVLECADAFNGESHEKADVVAVIGALVDGSSLRNPAERFGRVRRMIASALGQTRRIVVLVVARQDHLESDPLRSQDPSLGGIAPHEIPWLLGSCTTLGRVDGLLPNDLALILAHNPEDLPQLPSGAELRRRALAHPHALNVALPDLVRFHMEVGELETARTLLRTEEQRPNFTPDATWRLLKARFVLHAPQS